MCVLMDLLELICGKKVMVGVIDVVSYVIEILEEVVGILCKVLVFVDVDKFYLFINCGMVLLLCYVVIGKLYVLSVGVEIICCELVVK